MYPSIKKTQHQEENLLRPSAVIIKGYLLCKYKTKFQNTLRTYVMYSTTNRSANI